MREAEDIEMSGLWRPARRADCPLRDRLGLRRQEVGDVSTSVAGALPASAITINRMLDWPRAGSAARWRAVQAGHRPIIAAPMSSGSSCRPDPARPTTGSPLICAGGGAGARAGLGRSSRAAPPG